MAKRQSSCVWKNRPFSCCCYIRHQKAKRHGLVLVEGALSAHVHTHKRPHFLSAQSTFPPHSTEPIVVCTSAAGLDESHAKRAREGLGHLHPDLRLHLLLRALWLQ